MVLNDSVFRIDRNYYPQVFLEECKCIVREKRIPKYIIGDMKISSGESDKEDSDKESSQENSDKWNRKM